jgi:adenylate kinase family enzyme
VIFDACWANLTSKFGDKFCLPEKVLWLNGAPGSGKGANTQFIMRTVGASRMIPMSQLLQDNKEIKDIIARGDMVPDDLVLVALLDKLLDPAYGGLGGGTVMVDGFPRTTLQVELVGLLYDQLLVVHKHLVSKNLVKRPRPSFKTVILYVDEESSLRRQLSRGMEAEAASNLAQITGMVRECKIKPLAMTQLVKQAPRFD